MNAPNPLLSRRQFVKVSALAGAAVFGAPAFLRAENAGSKLNLALIGCGGQGRGRLNEMIDTGENIIALCDVDTAQFALAKKKAREKAKGRLDAIPCYVDYRELLEKEKSLDAVVIATPDHWHAQIVKDAMKAGKHVFCEKPLTRTIAEARELRELARSSKLVTQMGNQGGSNPDFRRAMEVIQAGALGAIHEIHVWVPGPGSLPGTPYPQTGDPVPEGLHWDAWCGVAAVHPYKRGFFHPFSWRGWFDYGNGTLGDFGCHNLNLPFRALNLDYPIRVEAISPRASHGMAAYPSDVAARLDFEVGEKRSPLTIWWYDGKRVPDLSLAPEIVAYFGEKSKDGEPSFPRDGTLIFGENGYTFGDAWKGASYVMLKGDKKLGGIENHPAFKSIPTTLPRSKGHMKEWTEACKGNGATFSGIEVGGHLTEIALAPAVALRTGQPLDWDGPAMKARNVPDAAQYVRSEDRTGWKL